MHPTIFLAARPYTLQRRHEPVALTPILIQSNLNTLTFVIVDVFLFVNFLFGSLCARSILLSVLNFSHRIVLSFSIRLILECGGIQNSKLSLCCNCVCCLRWEAFRLSSVWQGLQSVFQSHHPQSQAHRVQTVCLRDLLQSVSAQGRSTSSRGNSSSIVFKFTSNRAWKPAAACVRVYHTRNQQTKSVL